MSELRSRTAGSVLGSFFCRFVPRRRSLTLCPLCHGQGTTIKPPWVAGDQHTWAMPSTVTFTCRVCGGRGYLGAVSR